MVNIKKMFGNTKKGKDNEDDVLGDLDVGKELGRGGFSIVKEVHRRGEDAGILTAMKITPLALIEQSMGMNRQQTIARLERMKRVSLASRNKHIISFLEYRLSKTDLFTFGELCRGGDLFERIINSPDGRFTEEQAKAAARNLMGAINDCHKLGIIHRDIKPENIFYRLEDSPHEEIVLADFGCCVDEVFGDTCLRGTAGSPGYLPPEMAAHQPYNSLVDEWSAGITVYEMLTGRSPFVSQDPEQLNKEVLERAIPYPKQYWGHLSSEAKEFVQLLLEKDPRRRMSAAQSLEHPWLSGKKMERQNSLESDMMSDATDDSSDLQRMMTRPLSTTRSSIPRAASFGRPDILAAACTNCILGRKRPGKTQGEMYDTAEMMGKGSLTRAEVKRLRELDDITDETSSSSASTDSAMQH